MKTNKISVIGAGFVGSTSAFAIMEAGLAQEIVLIDVNREKALAEAMDLSHGAAFVKTVTVKAGSLEDSAGSDLIIITAGIGPKPGETRLEILNKNIPVFKDIVPKLATLSPEALILVVSNPVDILTYLTYKYSGFPANRVFGSGTVLDTSRFKSILAQRFGVDARNIHAYILGEHGDSELANWAGVRIAGMGLEEFAQAISLPMEADFKEQILDQVKTAAYEIINRKGYTNYAVALSVRRIVEAIVGNEQSILTLSSLFTGEEGICDVTLSMPCIIGSQGIRRILPIPLSLAERSALNRSADVLRTLITEAGLS